MIELRLQSKHSYYVHRKEKGNLVTTVVFPGAVATCDIMKNLSFIACQAVRKTKKIRKRWVIKICRDEGPRFQGSVMKITFSFVLQYCTKVTQT